MPDQDIRWIQRFEHFQKALKQLSKFIEKDVLNELEQQGLIQSFEYTYELAWNTMKDYFEQQGEADVIGSRDAFRLAFSLGIVEDGDTWMDMIKSRKLTSHTYHEPVANEVAQKIIDIYYEAFVAFEQTMLPRQEVHL